MFRFLKLRIALMAGLLVSVSAFIAPLTATGQSGYEDEEFGPVVRAYLGYLRNEQEVVDDRISRRSVTVAYYRRNSSRIRALRQMAMRIARETQNDYLPELEAVAGDEMNLLFENPPRANTLRIGEVLQTTFRYLGTVRAGESFYIFARLDPYEQAELMEKANHNRVNSANSAGDDSVNGPRALIRARRVNNPE